MEKLYLKFDNKSYEVKEPTVESWMRLSALKDLHNDIDFTTILIAESTGLLKEQIEQCDWQEVLIVSDKLTKYILEDGTKFYSKFTYDNVEYGFCDLPNLTFGEFIDIDSYLSKTELERKQQLNLLMAFFYRELDKDGKLTPYDSSKIAERSEKFKKLPIKYVNGATSFFLRLGKQSPSSLTLYSGNQFMMKMRLIWIAVRVIVLASIGVGSVLWSLLVMKISQKLRK
jgi:hypothetical protein